jgi:hypothetical protein
VCGYWLNASVLLRVPCPAVVGRISRDLPRGIFEPRNKRDAVDGLTVLGGERDPSQLRHLAIRDERGVGSEGGGALHMLAGQQG